MDHMTANDARAIMESTKEPERRALEEVIRYAQRKIKLAAGNNETDCLFDIPAFLPDAPPYAPQRMKMDLIRHFRGKGFYCKHADSTTIYISWLVRNQTQEAAEQAPEVRQGRLHLPVQPRGTAKWQYRPS